MKCLVPRPERAHEPRAIVGDKSQKACTYYLSHIHITMAKVLVKANAPLRIVLKVLSVAIWACLRDSSHDQSFSAARNSIAAVRPTEVCCELYASSMRTGRSLKKAHYGTVTISP